MNKALDTNTRIALDTEFIKRYGLRTTAVVAGVTDGAMRRACDGRPIARKTRRKVTMLLCKK